MTFSDIYALGWLLDLVTIGIWYDTSLMPFCLIYLLLLPVVAVITA